MTGAPEPAASVLVVDDEPDVLLLTRVILEGAGWQVQEALSGERALTLLREGEVPDVVLLDLRMPGMDGWQVLDELAQAGLEMPVIVFSAHAQPGTEREIRQRGGRGFLPKPFTAGQLIEVLQQALTS
jgi:CheY-like chemotaxis protein